MGGETDGDELKGYFNSNPGGTLISRILCAWS